MKFTLIMFGGPLLLLLLAARGVQHDAYGIVGTLWLLVSIPSVLLYWTVRIVRLAWGHKAPGAEP